MAVTIADRLHCRNDPRRISQLKIMLNFGAIISAVDIEETQAIEETHP